MSVVVLAYHQMGACGLRTLLRRRVEVSAVFTYEDDPGENIWFDSVADVARGAGIPVFTTQTINRAESVEKIRSLAPDVIFSFYYRHIVGAKIRSLPRYGCVNLHGSLLPKYRGRCPVNWQLVHGETTSGVTLHYMVGKPDAGDVIGQEPVPVLPDDTALDLYRKLLIAAEVALLKHLDGIVKGRAPRIPQDEARASSFGGRKPEDGRIDWSKPAREIHNLVRAVTRPWPGAFADFLGGRLMVWRSRPHDRAPGGPALGPGQFARTAAGSWLAGTGDGLLELLEFEAPGRRDLASLAPSVTRLTSGGPP